jgi:hypothetical protein
MTDIERLLQDIERAYSNPAPLDDGGTTEGEFLDLLERAIPALESFNELMEAAATVKRFAQPTCLNDLKWLDRIEAIEVQWTSGVKKPAV